MVAGPDFEACGQPKDSHTTRGGHPLLLDQGVYLTHELVESLARVGDEEPPALGLTTAVGFYRATHPRGEGPSGI